MVPVRNEGGNVAELVRRLSTALEGRHFELIFVDDDSDDGTASGLKALQDRYPLRVLAKQGRRGKAQSLLQGMAQAQGDCIALIDGDLQYPPEAIPQMLDVLARDGADVVVARRRHRESWLRQLGSHACTWLFRVAARQLRVDIQSGLKVFRRSACTDLVLDPSPWTFDFAFLLQCQRHGYRIVSHDVDFAPRQSGHSKVHMLPVTLEIVANLFLTTWRTPRLVALVGEPRSHRGQGYCYRGTRYITHSGLDLKRTAFHRFSLRQLLLLALIAAAVAAGLVLNLRWALLGMVSLVMCLYFADSAFSFILVTRSYGRHAFNAARLRADTRLGVWPRYTVLCPLFRERAVLPQFLRAMSRLDYPKDRLEVLLLLEEDDLETRDALQQLPQPGYLRVCTVPRSEPRTKPKACNYGLTLASGDYAVIYDAEDIPDRDQLKQAVATFEAARPELACVQAKLNYYNWNQSWLTRLFTLEYSLWFDLILPGLQAVGAPIPLGGTSNHFRVRDLRAFGGWDPFNVTEDADLGMRLAEAGRTTAIMDSTTLEEANSKYWNWIRQRSRWMKGYIQTYLVHSRSGGRLGGPLARLSFQLVIGSRVLAALLNPWLWGVTAAYFLNVGGVGTYIRSLWLPPVYYLGLTAFVLGNFLYIYYYMLGAAQRRHYELITSAFLSPLYWVLISFATYKALLEFLLRPFHWQKTTHGLHLSPESQSAFPGISAPEPDVDEGAPAAAQALPVAAVGGRAWAE